MYPYDEQETTLIYEPTLKRWRAYSCYPAHMTKLTKKTGEPYKKDIDKNGVMVAGYWYLTKRQISFLDAEPSERKRSSTVPFFKRRLQQTNNELEVVNQSE